MDSRKVGEKNTPIFGSVRWINARPHCLSHPSPIIVMLNHACLSSRFCFVCYKHALCYKLSMQRGQFFFFFNLIIKVNGYRC